MGQKSSSKISNKNGNLSNDKKASLQASINNKLKAYNSSIKQKIENNYQISNFNSNSYLAYNIKKKVDFKNEDKFSWMEYAEDECELIYSQKPYDWVEQTLRLLKYMKKDAKVREFQKNSIVSLIYTIETMTELDYLVDVPMEQYEDFFQEEELEEIVERQINEYNKTIKLKNQSIFGSGMNNNLESSNSSQNQRSYSIKSNKQNQADLAQTPVNIIEYNDNKISPLTEDYQRNKLDSIKDDCKVSMFSSQDCHNENHTIIQLRKNTSKNSMGVPNEAGENKNIRTLIERTPIFEEELEENIHGTKIDTNLMRSEVFTMMADQNTNILQYHAIMEERQQTRERNQTAISQMNNNTLLLNNAAVVALQENQNPNQSGANQVGNSNQQTAPEENDVYNDALKMVNFYKRISVFLEKSLEEKLNGLRALQKLYKKYFMKHYSEILMQHQKSGKMEVQEKIVDEMLIDIQQFIHFFLYCVIFFYDLDNLLPQKRHSQLVNKENLWNLLINIFFTDNEIYTLCFELIQVSLIEKERSLQSKMINLERVLPHHLEIDPKFCLNNKTIEWAKKQKLIKLQKNQSQAINQSSNQFLQVPSPLNTSPIPKSNQQITSLKNLESPPALRQVSPSLKNQQAAPSNLKKPDQLEMLEEESEFLFNEKSLSRHSSQIGLPKRAWSNSEYTPVEIITTDKENQRGQQKSINKSTVKSISNSVTGNNSSSAIIENNLVQQPLKAALLQPISTLEDNYSKQQNEQEHQTKEINFVREKRILSISKGNPKNQEYLDSYKISMQDEEGKDEILEDTCIPKLSYCDDKDNSFVIPVSQTQQKIPKIQVSSPKSQNVSSPKSNKSQNSQRSSSKAYSQKQQKLTPNSQEIRYSSYSNQSKNRHQEALKKLERTSSLDEKCPYYKAIKKLKNLTFYNSPVHKMKLLVQCFELIPECVSEFYEQNIDQFEQNLIASDDLINILVFIVLKSKCTQLNSHLKFISSFLSKSTQQSKIGYYCTTLQIVCGYLESDKIYENVESLRSKSEYFNQTILQMNTSFLRKSSFHQNIDITSVSNLNKIISNDKLEIQNSNLNNFNLEQQSDSQNHINAQDRDVITINIFENVVVA